MDISRNRIVQDKDNVGGLRAVYFHNYDEDHLTGGLTYTMDDDTMATAGNITVIAGGSFFKYDLRGTSTLTQSLTPSRDNGTIMSDQTLTLSLKKLSREDHADMFRLASQRPIIIVEDYNGKLQLVGLEYGADMEPSTIESGSQMGDLSGYSFVFKAMEKRPANFVDETAIWVAGSQGSADAANVITGNSVNGTPGTGTR